jgi:tyrosine-protein phosphatase SIW14
MALRRDDAARTLVRLGVPIAAVAALCLLPALHCCPGGRTATEAAPAPGDAHPAAREAPSPPQPTGGEPAAAAPARPEGWAVPLVEAGLPNLHKVSDDLYRGAQPDAEGMRALDAMGVKTVVNLRSFHSDEELLEGTGLTCEQITMKAYYPEYHEAVRFLRIVTDPEARPVFVHCRHGADRTGAMCALYRIVVQAWPADDAVQEMVEGGFGFHRVWRRTLEGFVRSTDAEQLVRAVSAGRAATGQAAEDGKE